MKKYRNFNWMAWYVILIYSVGLLFYFFKTFSSPNIFVLFALWCLIDLVEIKNLVKVDISSLIVFPQPFYKLFFKVFFNEFLSIKLISVFIASIFFLFFKNDFLPILFLFLTFTLQIITTIILYHIAYRYTIYSTLIRYLYLTPLLLLFLSHSFIKIMKFNLIITSGYWLAIYSFAVSLLLYISIVLLNRILHYTPFIKKQYLNKVKKNIWHW